MESWTLVVVVLTAACAALVVVLVVVDHRARRRDARLAARAEGRASAHGDEGRDGTDEAARAEHAARAASTDARAEAERLRQHAAGNLQGGHHPNGPLP